MVSTYAIILAAGESKRMGFPKMLLNFNGITMLERVINNVKGAGIENVMVVLGAEAEKLKIIAEKCGVIYCINNNYTEGMLSSVKCGIHNLPSSFRAVLVFPGDQPLIQPVSVNRILDAFEDSGKGIVIPVCRKKRGHPILIDSKYRNEILNLTDRGGLRTLVTLFPDDLLEVEVDDEGILKDFDNFDDYIREINQS